MNVIPYLGDNGCGGSLKIRRPKLAWIRQIQPATEIDQLQLTFFVLKIESGYFFLWNMIGIHT